MGGDSGADNQNPQDLNMGGEGQAPKSGLTAMKMKGLPFSVTKEDIIKFFQD